jgi:hypothetical protein
VGTTGSIAGTTRYTVGTYCGITGPNAGIINIADRWMDCGSFGIIL